MTRTALILFTLTLTLGLALAQTTVTDAHGNDVTITDTSRTITLGGSLTEIVYALGQQDNLVAVDTSSVYPAEADALPRVGYVRQLAAEGVLSLEPTLILATEDAGPPEVVEQLQSAGVTYLTVPSEDSVSGAKLKIATLGQVFGVQTQAEDLTRQIDLDIAEARLYTDAVATSTRPLVMFVYARGAGTLSVSGTDTSAHAMIELAGGENAVTDYEGYRPLTAEAAVNADPEVLLFLSRGLDSVGGVEGLRELPGLALTRAFETRRVVALDDLYLLGFGPRTGQAVLDLARAFYPDSRLSQP